MVLYTWPTNGELGTVALYCANEQGKFWQAHDLLMNNEGYELVNEKVLNDIGKAGEMACSLRVQSTLASLKSCIESERYKSRVTSDPHCERIWVRRDSHLLYQRQGG